MIHCEQLLQMNCMTTDSPQTLVMIRTKCCESFKCGTRCSICPNRPENRRITVVLLADKTALPQDSDFAR